MSPIHIKYLAHMKVRSSMSISINAFNDLWGLISCHSYGVQGMRVSFPVRKMCRLLGDTVSRNIERLSYASRLQARKLINTVPTESNPSGYIIASSDDLLQLFDADYGALTIRDETKILGDNTHSQEVLALLEFLRMRQMNTVLASHDIIKDFPDLQYAPGLKAISGLLYVPLSTGGSDFICFFRKGQLTEIKWAGNPYDVAKRKETAGYLEPRSSFAAWQETVLSQSREWSETDVETAAVLCLVYGKFIKVWRQKEAAMQNSQFTKLLLANSAHEVRTPLNAIINYLEIALEGALDRETRESLTKSHSASKSLIYVINDLLDLTNTEKGHELIKNEIFDLQTTFQEATDMLAGEAKRKNISYTVSAKPGLPRMVLGDQRRVRQVFSNLVSNAIQQTTSGAVTVEMWRSVKQDLPGHAAVEMMVLDTGAGMSKAKLEAIFHELEQVSTDEIYYQDEDPTTDQRPEKKRALGLGLALVARIVNNMQGQLGVNSEEGKGSRFKILLQFKLPEGVSTEVPPDAVMSSSAAVPHTPMISDREFTLVGGIAERREGRRRSSESLRSGSSSRSGRSHADRLISAIQEPTMVQRAFSDSSDMRQLRLSSSPPVRSTSLSAAMSSPRSNSVKRSSITHDPLASLSTVTHTPPLVLQPFRTPPAPGTANVTDSGVPMGAVRVSERDVQHRPRTAQQSEHKSYFPPMPIATTEKSLATSASAAPPSTVPTSVPPTTPPLLHVLVAEDDPVNSKIIHKRLTKLGHTVVLTGNGEACANAFTSASQDFDVVLMDIQMPIADGMTATRMIREFEATTPDALSHKAQKNERIPIFAVSASLLESEKQTYIDTGFDGWVMKPINFTRLNVLLNGLCNLEARAGASYKPGQWEIGGWFDT
jgi:signal transduction histidine kinase